MVLITVAGKLNDATFQQCKKAAEHLQSVEPGFKANIISFLPLDYDLFLTGILPAFPEIHRHNGNVLCYAGDPGTGAEYIGAMAKFLKWAKDTYAYVDGTHKIFYERLAKKHMRGVMDKAGREYCTLEIGVDGVAEGTLLVELFTDLAPKTCANFKAFVEGHPTIAGRYRGCPVHRIVQDGWIQTGDVVNGSGKGGVSIYGRTFADETFQVKHDKPGILAMANSGPHTNASQFYITAAPLEFLNGSKVGFGRCIDGLRTLKVINRAEVDVCERPVKNITILSCAMYTLELPEDTKGPKKATETFDTETEASAAKKTDKALAEE